MSAWSATPSPRLALLVPLTATVSSGNAAAVTLTPTSGRPGAAWRIKRLAASAGTLHYKADGTADGTGDYQLTSADPDSGWIWSSDASVSVYAGGGDVVYEIARLQG
jgi:hypothetical protein